jgi:hypothetical protein
LEILEYESQYLQEFGINFDYFSFIGKFDCIEALSAWNAHFDKEMRVRLSFPIVKGDSRAKHDILNFKQVPGFYSCHICKIEGGQLPRSNVVYYPPNADQTLRTHDAVPPLLDSSLFCRNSILKMVAAAKAAEADEEVPNDTPFLGKCSLLKIAPELELPFSLAFDDLHGREEGLAKAIMRILFSANIAGVSIERKYLDHLCNRIKCPLILSRDTFPLLILALVTF